MAQHASFVTSPSADRSLQRSSRPLELRAAG
jgi:hypothetical protein